MGAIIISVNKLRPRTYLCVVSFLFIGLLAGMVGVDVMDEWQFAAAGSQQVAPPAGKVSLVVKAQERLLEVYNDGEIHKKYRIAVGKSRTPTPVGEWKVVWKDYNWGTGFGTRWMGLNVPWGIYGIHGTNKPWSIGSFASHGCIRMRNKDVEELFEWVPIGTEVRIIGRKVRVERILKHKSSGADVVVLQLKLKELGLMDSRADGIFGPGTEEAVKRLQTENGLEANGVVDKKLAELLGI